ncbi:MAG: DEAD/DEAH box helicase [Chitinophagaceae bacterium]|nr:MAG: DEAD/DEAH box helicase [Chitinophagaceae bacterium]
MDDFQSLECEPVLEILLIDKTAPKSPFTNKLINSSELKKHFPSMPPPFRDVLNWFNKDGIEFTREEIKKKYSKQKAGKDFAEYYPGAMLRHILDLFERIKPFAQTIQWYHKIPVDNVRYKTAACSISRFRPSLQFQLTGTPEKIGLETQVNCNGDLYLVSDFTRFAFLLESRAEYFLLSYKDTQTLNWLAGVDMADYAGKPDAFIEEILTKLETDYTVERNGMFKPVAVEAELPVNRVMLSEISNSFLMLTPQWLYDGFLVEDKWEPEVKIVRNAAEYLVIRNKEHEEKFRSFLESLHPGFARQTNGYYYLSFADAQKSQWFAKAYHKLLTDNIEVTGMDMLKHFRYSPNQIITTSKLVREEGSSLILHLKITFGTEEVTLSEMQKMLHAGQRAVVLKDGSLGLLTEEWLKQHASIIKLGKISKNELRVPRWLAFSNNENAELSPVIQKDWMHKWKAWQNESDPIYLPDPMIKASLRPYQQKGFEWMMLLAEAGAGVCLADDMGLGKTLQTICFISSQLLLKPDTRHLIVCPSSLMYNWKKEFEKFAPHISVHIHHGAGRDVAKLTDRNINVFVTSYGTVRSDFGLFSALAFQTIILDESHNIKNPAAQITKLVNQLTATTKVALSGTPVMNNTFDLYAQLDFLLPGIFGSREYFKREYADPIDRDNDIEKIQGLQKLTAPFILRRTKEQVAPDLPAKTEMVMWCEMSAPQKELYESIKEQISSSLFLNIKKEGLQKNKLALLQGLMKLRQVCNSPLLLPEEERTCSDSIKTKMLMDELVNNLGAHKALVFSQFTSMLDMLAEECNRRGITYFKFDGQTPPAKRSEMVDAFQDPADKTNVFLISLKAGNAGLTLTAADYVFLFDPWWNTAVQQQAIDRTHRIGQTKSVFAYKMVCRDTIEEKIIQLQDRKKQLADDLISEEEGFVKALSEDDIKFLFS